MPLTPTSRRSFLRNTALGTAALATRTQAQSADRPNVLFLLTDDQRWDMMGSAGNSIVQTPHMDRLAHEGVRFRNHFVTTAICAVSRASFLTGLYSSCHGIHGFRTGLNEEQHARSYPVRLRESGYRTGFIGKYGVGRDMPEDRYDYWKGFPGQGRYLDKDDPTSRPHLTEIMGNQAQEFLDGCRDDQPWNLSISFKAPHVQDNEAPYFINDPKLDHMYSRVTIPDWKKNDPRYYDELPEFLKDDYEGRIRWVRRFGTPEDYQEKVKRYYRLISGVDIQIGRLLARLEEEGWLDNTVIVLAGDNGFFLGERGLAGKWTMHEESIRTPLVIRDPRATETAGSVRDELVLNVDVCPTILSAAGLAPHASTNGRDLTALVHGERPAWRTEFFYEHLFEHGTIPKTEGVRTTGWKYTRYIETDPLYEELFDLHSDAEEEFNLAPNFDYGRQKAFLEGRWQAWRTSLDTWRPDRPWTEPA